MQFSTKLALATITTTVALTFAAVGIHNSIAVAKPTVKTYPARYQHVWYHYNGDGRYDKMKFTAHNMSYTQNYENRIDISQSALHSRNSDANPVTLKDHPSWVMGLPVRVRGEHWVNIYGWNQTTGAGVYYGVANKTYRNRKLRVLTSAHGAGVWTDKHYYLSKKVAKSMGNKHLDGDSVLR